MPFALWLPVYVFEFHPVLYFTAGTWGQKIIFWANT